MTTARAEIDQVARAHRWTTIPVGNRRTSYVSGRRAATAEFDQTGRLRRAAVLHPKPFNEAPAEIEALPAGGRRQLLLAYLRGEPPGG